MIYDLPEEIQVHCDGPLRTIVLNRPDALNAVNEALHTGLARLWPQLSDDHEARAAILTGSGTVFSAGGDFAFLEQLRGDPLTPATDLFSLGVVLWELAAGVHPFLGASKTATSQAVSQAVLPGNPSFGLKAGPLSGPFEKIIRGLLSTNPAERPTASALQEQLENLLRRQPFRFTSWTWTAASLGAALLAVLLWARTQGRWNTEPPRSPQMVPFTAYEGSEAEPSFSPDGSRIAFTWTGEQNGNRNIYVKGLTDERPVQLTSDPDEDFSPVWSPDSSRIAFLRRGQDASSPDILVMPARGGEARVIGRIADPEGFAHPIAWWPDGNSIVARDATEKGLALVRIALDTGRRQVLTSPPPVETDSLRFWHRTAAGSRLCACRSTELWFACCRFRAASSAFNV